ncbi:MAG: hypothetical protein AAF621_00400 [Pseudomonadota bacterium]
MLDFPHHIRSKKNLKPEDYMPHFDFYIRGDQVSPFYDMMPRYLDLSERGIRYARKREEKKQYRDSLQDAADFYEVSKVMAPRDGYVSYLAAYAFTQMGQYEYAAKYLTDSYRLYPVSGRLAALRHRLSFKLLPYFKEDIIAMREQDYITIKALELRKGL